MEALLKRLRKDYKELDFRQSQEFSWSPRHKVISYRRSYDNEVGIWSLLHEVGHATLDHSRYHSDFELLHLEAAAWHKAAELAKGYGHKIAHDHIQDCLDTYRDWLHRRSTCPHCGTTSLQESSRRYRCHNCDTAWTVSSSRFCRAYRRWQQTKKPPAPERQATFS